jgi:hypothetical protein
VAASEAASRLDPDRHALYYDLVLAALSEAARKAFDMLPEGYRYQSEPMRNSFDRGRAEGRAEGKAEGSVWGMIAERSRAVLDILEARSLPLTDEQRSQIVGCSDLDRLRRWGRRAVSVASVAELLAD